MRQQGNKTNWREFGQSLSDALIIEFPDYDPEQGVEHPLVSLHTLLGLLSGKHLTVF